MNLSVSTHRLYWPLQLGGWLAYGATGLIINLSFDVGISAPKVAAMALSGSVLLLALTHLLRNYALRRRWTRLGFGPLILRLLAATFILSSVSQLVLSLLMFWPIDVISAERPYSARILVIYIFQTQIILLLWSLIYFSFHALRNYKREEIEKWRLQAAATDAALEALKAQINPHFMFNCLNNIRALVLEDGNRAREAITRLSDLLRYCLQYANARMVPLEQELDIVRDYLALEALHMEERLQYRIDAAPNTLRMGIPPMAVQLLVENAIKHGLARLPRGGEVSIAAQLVSGTLHIDVSNTGRLSQQDDSTSGIGLPNLRERLALLYGSGAELRLASREPDQVVATLRIPMSTLSTAACATPAALT